MNAPFNLLENKIQRRHHERLAIVYVRQSTVQQIEKHSESTKLQYALVDRAIQLGWSTECIMVIDDDLGISGSTAEGRPGFQKLVAEVGLDHVGIILGIEMSRLARSCRDWHQLLEVCSIFGTLIGDADGIYDPMTYNDRLLLGLKGTMSEAELHILKQRMLEGKRAKARRGELGVTVPMGYIRHPSGCTLKDPDEQAQSTIQLIFKLFEHYAAVNGVLKYFAQNKIQMPYRHKSGPQTGELEWRRPNRSTLFNLLKNPIYAGAYVYGRQRTDPRKKKPGRRSTGRTIVQPQEWEVLLKDHLPAYITWEQYEANIEQLTKNASQNVGVIRKGSSLLSGLLICGICGLRMLTQYRNNGSGLRYCCCCLTATYGVPNCQSLTGAPLEAHIISLVLQALQPAALEISLKVAEDVEAERARLQTHWKQRLERAEYEVKRAYQQYNAVDPENRLVARSLERQWEEALVAHETLKNDYSRFLAQKPATLSNEEREAIRQLATNIPGLWSASTTTAADRLAIVRYLIERIIITNENNTEKVNVEIHWMGGHCTNSMFMKPVGKVSQLSNYQELVSRIASLNTEGKTPTSIAQTLNSEGWYSPRQKGVFTASMVDRILYRIPHARRPRQHQVLDRQLNEWTLSELAKKLNMPMNTLYAWIKKGEVKARYGKTKANKDIWLILADVAELDRLQILRTTPKRWTRNGRPNEFIVQ